MTRLTSLTFLLGLLLVSRASEVAVVDTSAQSSTTESSTPAYGSDSDALFAKEASNLNHGVRANIQTQSAATSDSIALDPPQHLEVFEPTHEWKQVCEFFFLVGHLWVSHQPDF
jgi:hypothetical protein